MRAIRSVHHRSDDTGRTIATRTLHPGSHEVTHLRRVHVGRAHSNLIVELLLAVTNVSEARDARLRW